MDLHILWFLLIGVLFAGFFFLEGFDFGVAMLLPFLGKNDSERRTILNSVGPFWDGNEVWLITAVGAMFAAFPNWYATFFSGFYLIIILMLASLIIRGAAFKFRSKRESQRWRRSWDTANCIASALPGFLWGVATANTLMGLAIDQQMNYIGTFWQLLNPVALLSGLAFTAIFLLHGALFLSLKVEETLAARATAIAKQLWMVSTLLIVITTLVLAWSTGIAARLNTLALVGLALTGLVMLVGGFFLWRKRFGLSFIFNGATIVFATAVVFLMLFPNVMISSLNTAWNLTIYNASSSPYALTVMSVIALTCVPFVLAYQIWSYWVFRKRVTQHAPGHY